MTGEAKGTFGETSHELTRSLWGLWWAGNLLRGGNGTRRRQKEFRTHPVRIAETIVIDCWKSIELRDDTTMKFASVSVLPCTQSRIRNLENLAARNSEDLQYWFDVSNDMPENATRPCLHRTLCAYVHVQVNWLWGPLHGEILHLQIMHTVTSWRWAAYSHRSTSPDFPGYGHNYTWGFFGSRKRAAAQSAFSLLSATYQPLNTVFQLPGELIFQHPFLSGSYSRVGVIQEGELFFQCNLLHITIAKQNSFKPLQN